LSQRLAILFFEGAIDLTKRHEKLCIVRFEFNKSGFGMFIESRLQTVTNAAMLIKAGHVKICVTV